MGAKPEWVAVPRLGRTQCATLSPWSSTLRWERSRMIQQWDFPVDEPASLPEWREKGLAGHLPGVAAGVAAGETLRTVASEYGVSHEALRRTLKQAGFATSKGAAPAAALRRTHRHRVIGRGRAVLISPAEANLLLGQHRNGESIRSLARATGVSHETMRRTLAMTADRGYSSAWA